jgi:DNA-binding transcriptional LysR family regulator
MTNFDMNWIVVFNAIYEEKTLTRAAERLEMSEKTLGLILKKLRDYFADPLFVRSNVGFTPTPVATELYLKFYKTEMYLQQALNPRSTNSETGADKKIILSMPSHAEFAFNQVYSNAADLFADYSLRLRAAESPEKEINNLRHGHTDMYISLEPLEDSFITNETLSTISMALCLIVRQNHANLTNIVQHHAFSTEKFISCTQYPILEEYFSDNMAFTPNIGYRSQSLINLLSIAEQQDVILIAPMFFSNLLKLDERFHVIYLDANNSISKTAYCSYLKNSKKRDSIKEINKLIKNQAQATQLRSLT